MSALIYIHGFLSSPRSLKALQVQAWLQAHRPDIRYECPFLTPYPGQVQRQLEALVQALQPQPVYLLGSSLGGYWATWLAEQFDLRAVLINPAVRPSMLMPEFLGATLQNYHTADTYQLTPAHIDEIRAVDTPQLQRPANYWVLLQSADETLDYRRAVAKYRACRQLVEAGGDHGFQGFERWLPAILDFFEAPAPG